MILPDRPFYGLLIRLSHVINQLLHLSHACADVRFVGKSLFPEERNYHVTA